MLIVLRNSDAENSFLVGQNVDQEHFLVIFDDIKVCNLFQFQQHTEIGIQVSLSVHYLSLQSRNRERGGVGVQSSNDFLIIPELAESEFVRSGSGRNLTDADSWGAPCVEFDDSHGL